MSELRTLATCIGVAAIVLFVYRSINPDHEAIVQAAPRRQGIGLLGQLHAVRHRLRWHERLSPVLRSLLQRIGTMLPCRGRASCIEWLRVP